MGGIAGLKFHIPTEHAEQKSLLEWCVLMEHQAPELKLLFAIPNGGYRSRRTAGRMKAEGLKAGVPDLFLPVARGEFHGMFVELKRRKGGRTTSLQDQWHLALLCNGYHVVIANGAEEASAALGSYLGIPDALWLR